MKGDLLYRQRKGIFLGAITLFLLLTAGYLPVAAAFSGAPYCSLPPLAGSGVKANLLLMLDNSASMYDLAYTDPDAYCIDGDNRQGSSSGYHNDFAYSGYFDRSSIYSYDNTNAKFVSGATLPLTPCSSTSCVASNSYLYLEMAGLPPNRTVSVFKASGNFLNWLTMSKLDLEKQVLTGGKFQFDANGTSGMLLAETRGCLGRRFVKLLADAPQVTFAIRGPAASDTDFVYRASHGGGTRIEIYDKAYNRDACLAAVRDYQNTGGALFDLQTDVKACLGPDNLTEIWNNASIVSKSGVYLDIMSRCYATPNNVMGDGVLLQDCTQRMNKYGADPSTIPKNTGDDVCAQNLSHAPAVHIHNGVALTDDKGFIGNCYDARYFLFKTPCIEDEAEDYCREITSPSNTDPAAIASASATALNVPSFILDAGIYSIGTVAGVFRVRVSAGAAPTGLVQEYSPEINFGAMIFNDNGAGSECKHENSTLPNAGIADGDIACVKHCMKSTVDYGRECHFDSDCSGLGYGTKCLEIAPTDGGKVLAPINSPLGDHKNAGLINSLDQFIANSWTPLAESFYNAIGYFANRTDLRLQAGDFSGPSPSVYSCQRNNILIVSDGGSTADRNPAVNNLVAKAQQDWAGVMPASMTTSGSEALPVYRGSYNLDDLAWIAHNVNITDFSQPLAAQKDRISTYVVYTGIPCGNRGTGAGYDGNGNCTTSDEGVPEKMMQLAASKGGGRVASVQSQSDLEGAIREMLQQVAAGSGTAPSILSTGDDNGALYLQEQFYPVKSFDDGKTSASWIGEMQSLWYYIDPFMNGSAGAGSTIREDTPGLHRLDLKSDRIVNFLFDPASNRSYAKLTTDLNGDGMGGGAVTSVEAGQVKSLWLAGQQLWSRDLVAAPRTIYLPLLSGGSEWNGSGLMKFAPDASTALLPYLNLQAGDPDPVRLINFVHGFDFPDDPGMRSRTIGITGVTVASDPQNTGVGVWKLGDIISSNPQVQSPVPLGSYHLPTPAGYADSTYRSFINSAAYGNPGAVYVGANDGMLHAFNLGTLIRKPSDLARLDGSPYLKAALTGADAGKELWSFIPKNVLPYLKYLADPQYNHLYFVDGKSSLFDASIGNTAGGCPQGNYWECPRTAASWRTILIGSMGLGGASAKSCAPSQNCVQTPIIDPADSSAGFGYSSYFALDVTDPLRPSLLWEFSDPDLGYSTSGPAIVRVGGLAPDGTPLNGRWFAVFGSGPTGPVDITTRQFKARSNRNLKLFVLDLRTGTVLRTFDTGIAYAFAGSMTGGAVDADRWDPTAAGKYQDDAVYLGYTKSSTSSDLTTDTWTEGGVLRILTNESSDPSDPVNPWTVSTVIDGIGPVTTGIARIQDRKNHRLWLYLGTGRYFFPQDDMQSPRAIMGLKEPCYDVKVAGVDPKVDKFNQQKCAAPVSGTLLDQSTTVHTLAPEDPGWVINLDPPLGSSGAERLTSDPVSIAGGAVFFATFQPSTDLCLFGNSFLWGVRYDTGGEIPNGSLQGKALVPLSTGGVQENRLSGTFTDRGGRRSAAMPGKPSGVRIVSNSGLRPLKKIIHIQER